MKNMAKSVLAWMLAAALIGFWPLYLVLGNVMMMELSTRLVAGVCLAIFIQWAKEGWISIRRGRRASDFVIAGVCAIALTTYFHRETVNNFRIGGLRDWLMNSFLLPMVVWIMAFGFSILLIAKGTRNGEIPAENFGWLAFAFIYAIGLAWASTLI